MDNSNSNQGEKPKTIATIDVKLHWPKIEKRTWIEESLNNHFHCVLCGQSLQFKHDTDFVNLIVVENAHCPNCNIRNRENVFILQ